MYYFKVKIVILLYGISLAYGFFHFRHEDFVLENERSVYVNISMLKRAPTHWIEQPVDHFSSSDQRTWKQKYYKIMDSWKPGGPILLYINGEAPLRLSKLEKTYLKNYGGDSQSLIRQIVEETGSAYFMLEHRYYGTSQPFDTPTTANMAFLNARQALADTAHLLTTLKQSPEFKDSKVIVVGCSYAGNLAAWMKVMYPRLIDAVLSSCAPVLAKKDFNEYFEIVTETFRTYGSQDCVRKVTDRFDRFRALLQSSEGIEKLKAENRICEADDMTVPKNQQLFFFTKAYTFAYAAQYGSPDTVSSICKDYNFSELDRQVSNPWKYNNCITCDYNQWILDMNASDIRPWTYQTCSEFGYYQTMFSNKQMFGNAVPGDFYYETCRRVFGEEFIESRIEQGVTNTNRLYGGRTPNVTKVVFVNGDMDPWHSLGIVRDISVDAPAIYIKGSSHCHDFSPDPNDSEHIKEAREMIKKLLKKWI